MNEYGLHKNRQTGRTTRMLKVACLAAKAGGSIAVLSVGHHDSRRAFDICHDRGLADGAQFNHVDWTIRFPSGGVVWFIATTTPKEQLQGVRIDATLTDHFVRELECERLIQHAAQLAIDAARDAAVRE